MYIFSHLFGPAGARVGPPLPLPKEDRQPLSAATHVTSKSPVGDISVVTLIRTDTTLDHSQKAEKVCLSVANMISSMLLLVHKYGSDSMLESWDMLQPLLHANTRLLVH